MSQLHLNCRTCEFFLNGKCMNYKSEVYYNQVIKEYAEEGKSCWSISLNYFTTLMNTLPLSDQRLIQENDINIFDFMERIETGAWGKHVKHRIQHHSYESEELLPYSAGAAFAAYV